MPTFDLRQVTQPGARTSLSPADLLELTDRLVMDDALAWRIAGIDPASPGRPLATTTEELYVWANILSDAREMELLTAPALVDYLMTFRGAAIGVAGTGVAVTDLVSVVGAAGAFLGLAGGAYSLIAGIPLFRRDIRCMERLNAIDRAASIVYGASIDLT